MVLCLFLSSGFSGLGFLFLQTLEIRPQMDMSASSMAMLILQQARLLMLNLPLPPPRWFRDSCLWVFGCLGLRDMGFIVEVLGFVFRTLWCAFFLRLFPGFTQTATNLNLLALKNSP